jgi:hypothetical protein
MRAAFQTAAKSSLSAPSTFTPVRSRLLQRKCACGGTRGPTGECEACRKKKLQRRSENLDLSSSSHPPSSISEVPPIVHEVLRSPGLPLDTETRAFMEPRFGHNFSHVRVHADTKAAKSARAVNALAYTIGRDVVFGAGQYRPASAGGRELLAHELTHTIQQGNGTGSGISKELDAGNAAEREAVMAAQMISSGKTYRSAQSYGPSLARQPIGTDISASGPNPTPAPTYGITTGPTAPFPPKINFWFHAFIPDTVSGARKAPAGPYAGRTVFPSPPHPFHQNSCFETDERGFDSSVAASSRARVVGILDTGTSTLGSAAVSDLTFEIDCTSGSPKCAKTPSPSVSVSLVPGFLTPAGQWLITFSVTANDPCVTGSPDLSARGIITIDRISRIFSFTGATSFYPAFEMYASFGGGPAPVFKQAPIIDSPFALLAPGVNPRNDKITF